MHLAVVGAHVRTLAVHHHAAGEYEATSKADVVHGAQECGRAEVVVDHVALDVTEVHAEAHHRRLVAHTVDAREEPREQAVIRHVARDTRSAGVAVRRGSAVERDHVMVGGHQRVDDVRADEARRARNEHPHVGDVKR